MGNDSTTPGKTPDPKEGSRPGSSDRASATHSGAAQGAAALIPDELPDELRRELVDEAARLEEISFADASMNARSDLRVTWRWTVFGIGLFLSLYHLYTALFGAPTSLIHRSIHLSLGLTLVFLLYPARVVHTRRSQIGGWVLAGVAVLVIAVFLGNDATTTRSFATWNIAAPALMVTGLVQVARHVRVTIVGLPAADVVLAALSLGFGWYVLHYGTGIMMRAGNHSELDVAVGTVAMLLVLVATQRVIGTPLVVVASAMLLFAHFGQQMPGFLAHSGFTLRTMVSNLMLTTEGVLGTPIDVSSRFIFLLMIFAAMLQRTGMERFFTQLAFGMTGGMIGGTAKVGVLTSAFSGTITGSSVANTVSNGAFTIPMMKKSGYRGEFAGAVEAASSTGGQLAPPIMGAAAFIMIEFIDTTYTEIIKAAAIPALLFFTAQFIVIHYESKRLGIMGLPKDQLPNVRRLMTTKGYLLVPIVVIFVLLAQGRSVTRAALMAILATVVVNMIVQLVAAPLGHLRDRRQRAASSERTTAGSAPRVLASIAASGLAIGMLVWTFVAFSQRGSVPDWTLWASLAAVLVNVVVQGRLTTLDVWRDLDDRLTPITLINGLVDASRIALPIIAACAAAGMIAGVITLTGVGLQLTDALLTLSGETVLLTLFFSMIACLILGIGVPTTANYVITATLVAPAIVAVTGDPSMFAVVIAAHMFVYYFGIMADITPPVCLASYAAAGIAQANPLRTGMHSFRIAISGFLVPYMFVLTPQLLLQDVTWFTGTKAAATALLGVFAVGTAVVGFIDRRLPWVVRVVLLAAGLMLLVADLTTDLAGLLIFAAIMVWQWWTGPRAKRLASQSTAEDSHGFVATTEEEHA